MTALVPLAERRHESVEGTLGRWLTVVVMHIFLFCVGGVGGPFEGVRWPLGVAREPQMLGCRWPSCVGGIGGPFEGKRWPFGVAREPHMLGCRWPSLDGMELVHGTLLARAAEALAMDQDV